MTVVALQDVKIASATTAGPYPSLAVGIEGAGAAVRMQSAYLSSDIGGQILRSALLPALSLYTERKGDDLLQFIVANLDEEEKSWFIEDVANALIEARSLHSLKPVGRTGRDWERTVEIKLDPVLSRVLAEALDEADAEQTSCQD